MRIRRPKAEGRKKPEIRIRPISSFGFPRDAVGFRTEEAGASPVLGLRVILKCLEIKASVFRRTGGNTSRGHFTRKPVRITIKAGGFLYILPVRRPVNQPSITVRTGKARSNTWRVRGFTRVKKPVAKLSHLSEDVASMNRTKRMKITCYRCSAAGKGWL